MDVFINSAEAISPQNTFDTDEFLTPVEDLSQSYFTCITPEYKKYISPKLLRRMSKIVRMGVATSTKALLSANVDQPDAIIFGTGLGCVDDTLKFLNQLIENDELLLNPTAFIQSTHNTVSGQVALILGCKNYNFTFTQQSVSFETALIEASIKLSEKQGSNILLGATDEITEKSFELLQQAGCTKTVDNSDKTNAKGYVPGEGASCFVLSNTQTENSMAKLKGVSIFNSLESANKLPSDLNALICKAGISPNDIDVLITGANESSIVENEYTIVKQLFNSSIHIPYKKLVGEYDTASGFAMWLASTMLSKQLIPEVIVENANSPEKINNILIHNYSTEHNHLFILLSKC